MPIIKVAGDSPAKAAAGSIAGAVREHGYAVAQAIGADAVNQAAKAVAIATRYLRRDGIDAVCSIKFVRSGLGLSAEKNALRFVVAPRNPPPAGSPAEPEPADEEEEEP